MYNFVSLGRRIGMLFLLFLLFNSCNDKGGAQTDTARQSTKEVKPAPLKFDRYWNDFARYLAGLEPLPGSKLDSVDNRPEAIAHRQYLDIEWQRKDSVLLKKLRKWAQNEIPDAHNLDRNVFYPFSGPDFLHVQTLYPNSKLLVFFGLEDEGDPTIDIRNVPKERLAPNLKNLQAGLNDALKISFFVTRDMQQQFRATDLKGALPNLLVFLARTGYEVIDVDRIKITPNATIDTVAPTEQIKQTIKDNIVTGVEIKFRQNENAPLQRLQYFSFDAQDIEIKKHEHDLLKYFSSLKPASCYLKSASYLLHYLTYSVVRNKIFEICDIIVQDDTGIGFRYFDKNMWDIKLYGAYTGPINIYRSQFERDLDAAYKKDITIKPVDFDMGYKSRTANSTNLLVARRKQK